MSYLEEGSCHICSNAHVIFVGERMSYLYEGSCHICRKAHDPCYKYDMSLLTNMA